MVYSQLYFKNTTKIPTIASFLFIIFIILVFFRIFSGLSQPSKASGEKLVRMEITNISPSSVTVFWQTEKKEEGWLVYGVSPQKMTTPIFDERDLPSKKNSYFTHYVTIRGLEENKQYFFAIVSGNKLFKNYNHTPLTFTTASKITSIKNQSPAYGRVLQSNGEPLLKAVVLLGTEEKIFASTLTKSTGEWLISMNFEKLTSSKKIKIEIISEENQISKISTVIDKVSPLPQTIIIGKNYDFTQEDNVLSVTSTNLVYEDKEINIIYPQEKAIIPGRTPLIKGIASPNAIVFITIKSTKTYSAKIKADEKGFWSFLPPQPLSLGEHIITIITKDRQGKEITIERKFTIIGKEGANVSVLGEATPSATVTPYQTSPTPTEMIVVTPTPSTPVPGNSVVVFPIVLGISFFMIGLGVIFAF